MYSFTVEASDDNANLVCEAKNILSHSAFKAELNLTVLCKSSKYFDYLLLLQNINKFCFYFSKVAPKEVTIAGATEARVGDIVQLGCVTAPSNPPSRISWSLNGRPLSNSTYNTQMSADGGWFSISNVSINIDANSRTFVAVCHALNVELTQNVVGSHSVNVLCMYKPIVTVKYIFYVMSSPFL